VKASAASVKAGTKSRAVAFIAIILLLCRGTWMAKLMYNADHTAQKA